MTSAIGALGTAAGDGVAAGLAFDEVHLTLGGGAGPVNILMDIELAIAPGERVSLVGPSGSGKSSLMMIAAGLQRPSRGRVRVAGRDLGPLNEDALARFRRDHIGIVFQDFHLIPTMTALENTAIPLEFAGHEDAFGRAEEILTAVGLGPRLRHHPGELSGGEQQRVALARALAPRPHLLLADEPTGNLDHGTGGRIIDLMFELAERDGATLLLITHDSAIAARCPRRIELSDGRITADRVAEAAE